MFFGSQDRFEIEVMDSEGTTHPLIRVLEEPIPITDAAWAEYYEERVEEIARDEFDVEYVQLFRLTRGGA
jgi:hypothetical protein